MAGEPQRGGGFLGAKDLNIGIDARWYSLDRRLFLQTGEAGFELLGGGWVVGLSGSYTWSLDTPILSLWFLMFLGEVVYTVSVVMFWAWRGCVEVSLRMVMGRVGLLGGGRDMEVICDLFVPTVDLGSWVLLYLMDWWVGRECWGVG